MAFTVTYSPDQATGDHVVTVKALLSLEETNSLFLSGEGLLLDSPDSADLESAGHGQDTALTRTGMFVSELARLAQGLKIGYRQSADAERAAQLIRLQLLRAGISEEI